MTSSGSLPEDPRLTEIAKEIERTRWAAVLCDSEWKLVWISPELKALLGEEDEERLGFGRHLIRAYLSEPWWSSVTGDTRMRLFSEILPRIIGDTFAGKEKLISAAPEHFVEALEQITPINAPALWSSEIQFVQGDLPPTDVTYVAVRLVDRDGTFLGTAFLYGSSLPARILALVARGDRGAFERMARLYRPGRRAAALLFADLQLSGVLSRRLPSAVYFDLIRSLTTEIDQVVVNKLGIVGKHAGDGVTAFFLTSDLGSPSAAAKAAIEAARGIAAAATSVASSMSKDGQISVSDCMVNAGVHWSDTLYMGQLITGGRLEVTALGDAVNECARLQETARDGEVLVSKSLIEQLDGADSSVLGLDPAGLTYQTLAEVPGAGEKARRDAGTIPVVSL